MARRTRSKQRRQGRRERNHRHGLELLQKEGRSRGKGSTIEVAHRGGVGLAMTFSGHTVPAEDVLDGAGS